MKYGKLTVCVCRFEQLTEWTAQAVYEGPVCGTVSDCACSSVFTPTLPAHVDGPPSVGTQWLTNTRQPGKLFCSCSYPTSPLPLNGSQTLVSQVSFCVLLLPDLPLLMDTLNYSQIKVSTVVHY